MPLQLKELLLEDREIVPMTHNRFGVVLTKEEAEKFVIDGYNIQTLPWRKDEETTYYLVVWVGMPRVGSARDGGTRVTGFDLAMLETAERSDVLIRPEPWSVGKRCGLKAYVVSTWTKEGNDTSPS